MNLEESTLEEIVVQLQELVEHLRLECPWDKQQTPLSLRRHLLEEAYEVLEAIDNLDDPDRSVADNYKALQDELGDLLYQVFFLSLLAKEAGHFEIRDVVKNIHDKLRRRHPHVFGDLEIETTDELAPHWEEIKKAEKDTESVMDKLPGGLPALLFAAKVQKKAKVVGYPSHSDTSQAIQEVRDSLEKMQANDKPKNQEALGELLWATIALSVELDLDGEDALRQTAQKFANLVRKSEIKK